MADLSVTTHGNRVSLVGDVRSWLDRDRIMAAVELALVDQTLSRTDAEVLVLDVTRLEVFDSPALVMLVGIARRCVDVGMQLVIDGASEELRSQLAMSGLDDLLGARGAELRQPDDSDSTGAIA